MTQALVIPKWGAGMAHSQRKRHAAQAPKQVAQAPCVRCDVLSTEAGAQASCVTT